MRNKNIDLNILISTLNSSEKKLSSDLLDFWKSIRIEPIEWVQHSDEHIRLFWVVALLEDDVVWYNHLTNIFISSNFSEYSIIGNKSMDNSKVQEVITILNTAI